MKNKFFQILCLNVVTIMSFPPENVMLALMEKFQIYNPVVINTLPKTNQYENVKLFKLLSNIGHITSFKNITNHPFQSFIVMTDLHNFKLEIQSKAPTIVITDINSKLDLAHVKLSIDSEIYFIDKKSFIVYETYIINTVQITNYLGQFKFENGVSFEADKDFNSMLVERRSNFHGIQLNAMVELEPHMIYFPSDFASKVKYFSNNQTYDMTNIVEGVLIDVLHLLEKKYNFSTQLYKRKDGEWGLAELLHNGTYRRGII